MTSYLTSSAFMELILLTIWFRAPFAIQRGSSLHRCRFLICATVLYVLLDAAFICCHFNTQWPGIVFQSIAFLFYVGYTLLPFSWHMFVRNFVGTSFQQKTRNFEYVPMVILLAMIAATPFTGALWSIDAENVYHRGPLFLFYTYFNYFYYIDPALYALVTVFRKSREKEPYLLQAVIISFVPLIGALVNNFIIPIYEIFPFQPFCSVLVALMAYFFMAARESDRIKDDQQLTIQQALQQTQEAMNRANEASAVKSTFLSNMSHDIRTPMNAIINLTELARQETDPAVIHEYLDKMDVSGRFLLGLINDILDMSKIENGELELNCENLTRTEFITTVETVIRPLMEANHVHYHPEVRPGEYTISVDKLRFNQIFFNLLSNAAKFTPEGGDVWFEVTNLETDSGKLKIQFVVRDNGIGMSEDFLQHLFEPFAREHSALSEKTQGTGLGLPIVKSLVEAMNGSISVKSKLGEGTEFIVILNVDIVTREEIPPATAAEEADANLDGMRILLVEDNELNTYVAKIILENAGCAITTAANGQEAVDAFSASEPFFYDAILMDVRMPVMDGIRATQAIRSLPRDDSESVAIIAMTADAFDDERKRTLEAGMNYHLAKPVDAQQLYRILSECRTK